MASGDLWNLGLIPARLCSGPSKASILEVKLHPPVLLCLLPLVTAASLLPREQCQDSTILAFVLHALLEPSSTWLSLWPLLQEPPTHPPSP